MKSTHAIFVTKDELKNVKRSTKIENEVLANVDDTIAFVDAESKEFVSATIKEIKGQEIEYAVDEIKENMYVMEVVSDEKGSEHTRYHVVNQRQGKAMQKQLAKNENTVSSEVIAKWAFSDDKIENPELIEEVKSMLAKNKPIRATRHVARVLGIKNWQAKGWIQQNVK